MEKEAEELQHLGVWGILKESFSFLRSYARLLASLSLTLILPLCFIILGHKLITAPLFAKIHTDLQAVGGDPDPSVTTPSEARTLRDLALERSRLLLFLTIYLLFVLAFSLLSTAAVVYAVACGYSGKAVSYARVMSVVPQVWKRLLATLFWAFLLMFCFQVVAAICIVLALFLLGDSDSFVGSACIWILVSVLFAALAFLSCIWHLASVISVLENLFGLAAMRKSTHLIQGKALLAFCLFSTYLFVTIAIGSIFDSVVVINSPHHNIATRVAAAAALILILTFVTLIEMLVQTVFYFACKAYHHESIDRLALSEHLGGYSGEYVPLKASIQMESLGA